MSSLTLVRDIDTLPPTLKGGVVVMGNFDGMHRGHQALLHKASALARATSCPLIMLTFEPHPRQLFNKTEPSFRLMPLTAKIACLQQFNATCGLALKAVIALRFTHRLASMRAQDFIQSILCHALRTTHVFTGRDFRFGKQRLGDRHMLAACHAFSYHAIDIVTMSDDETRVSSSLLRAWIAAGDVERATPFLHRPWTWRGHVIRGAQRGRKIGFPTANMRPPRHSLQPPYGVYIVKTRVPSLQPEGWLPAIANIGMRPTFQGTMPLLETHILDDTVAASLPPLYGHIMYTSFISFLRQERAFPSPHALQQRLQKDCEQARLFWYHHAESL
ncbi:MAG: riboflavin biosynthesis protein RibF [Alphaproteobacteria bacterium GM7ARS4]|nr:riboflavin biosynthesis protein RibF [Alphaproteobacteria bacterium GM7ARS4]